MRKYNISERERELVQKIHEKLSELGKRPQPINWNSRRLFMSLCPFHDDHNPSFNVYVAETGRVLYKCFGCDAKGTIRQLAGRLGVDTDTVSEGQFRKTQSTDFIFNNDEIQDFVEKAHKRLLEFYSGEGTLDKTHYLVKRGFLKDGDSYEEARKFIERYYLGITDVLTCERRPFAERLIIPYFNREGIPVWFNARAIYDSEIYKEAGLPDVKYLTPKGDKMPYNEIAVDYALEQGFVFIVEGELDAISLMEATDQTIPVIGIPGEGYTNENFKKLFRELAEGKVIIYILTDPDSKGQDIARGISDIVHQFGGIPFTVHLTKDSKEIFRGDINDALKELGKETLRKEIDEIIAKNKPTGDLWYISNLNALVERERNLPTFPTGIPEIDDALGGGYREGLHIIGGLTASGKTSLALRIALNNALEERPVVYITYEQSKLELWARVLVSITSGRISYYDIKDGKFPDLKNLEEWEQIEKVAKYLKIIEGDAGLIDGFSAVYTIKEIEVLVRAIKAENHQAPMIIIDYLQRMPAGKELKRKDLRERIDSNLAGLQTNIARAHGCPVIVLSSIARSGYEITKDTPFSKKLQVFKESGGIEFTGYTVAFLWTEDRQSYPVLIHFDLLKNRESGVIKDIKLEFRPDINEWKGVVEA